MDKEYDELDFKSNNDDAISNIEVGANDNLNEKNESKANNKEYLNIKLGLIIPHREVAIDKNLEKIKSEFMKKTAVKFLAEQFENQEIKFNVVDIEVVSEATATLLDEVIESDYSINTNYYHPTTMSVGIDIGSSSTDFVSMLGVDIINGSEKRLNVGVDDLLDEIMNKVEEIYDVPFETLDMDNIATSLRYTTIICENCGTIMTTKDDNCKCGGELVAKKNILRIGRRGFDVTEILEEIVEKTSKRIVEFFSTYIRRIFRLRGIALNQLENVTLSGGGAELIGDSLKIKLEKELGNFVVVKKALKPVRKNVDGLSKLIYHTSTEKNDIDAYVAIDVGCSAVKSKILDKNGQEIIKGIEIPSRIGEPVKMASYKIRKVKPLADLHVSIQSETSGMGQGQYFVGQLAYKGGGQVRQSNFINKSDDNVFYTLAYTSIATLIARLNHKINI